MIERSNLDENEGEKSRIHNKSFYTNRKKVTTQRTGSEKKWMETEKDIRNDNNSVSLAQEHDESEVYLDNKETKLVIRKNNENFNPLKKRGLNKSIQNSKRTQSKEAVVSVKSFKFTNQMEKIEKKDTIGEINVRSSS